MARKDKDAELMKEKVATESSTSNGQNLLKSIGNFPLIFWNEL